MPEVGELLDRRRARERPPAERRIAGEVDALAQPQAHHQHLDRLLRRRDRARARDAGRRASSTAVEPGLRAAAASRSPSAHAVAASAGRARPARCRRSRRSASRSGCAGSPPRAGRGSRSRSPAARPRAQISCVARYMSAARPAVGQAAQPAARGELAEARARLDGQLIERQVVHRHRQRLAAARPARRRGPGPAAHRSGRS